MRVAAISVIAACAVVAAFVCAVLFLEPLQEARVELLKAATEAVLAHDVDLEPARDESARTVYPFSVIPGGVRSAEEFAEAVATDPAVGAHYGDVMPAAMHVKTVDAPRAAYMSYRIGDQIYWTKRKLALHEGEQVLSDGSVTIRSRCGNRLADEPMQPTSEAEPPVEAFEGPVPPVVAAPGPEVVHPVGSLLPLAAMPPLEPGMQPVDSSDPWASVPFAFGLGAFGIPLLTDSSVGSPADEGSDEPIAFVFPPTITDGDGGGGPNPPGLIVEVPGLSTLNPPSDDHPSDGIPGGPPLGGPEIPGGGSNGELPRPVVPEPTSLTLFGTGALWMAIKRYRQGKP
ncbi:MAG TPA: PEP-CTERM sorting domain-containing protein [Vicinamibacterales bacterium]|nr:PEP-CTERM sorting domain-containing protein [Vicinamibacterales bacterium]